MASLDYFQLSIQAFRDKERIKSKQFCSIESGKYFIDGYRATEVQISSVLFSQKDVCDLIEVLSVLKHSFNRPEERCNKCGEPL